MVNFSTSKNTEESIGEARWQAKNGQNSLEIGYFALKWTVEG
jgi:hypothetical protein